MQDHELPGMWSYSDFTYGQTDAEEESAMSTITAIGSDGPSFHDWLKTEKKNQRRAQAMMNALPNHLYNFISGTLLDVFYTISSGEPRWDEVSHERRQEDLTKMSRFMTWVYLCWDITDKEEMDEAYRLVMSVRLEDQ